MPARRAQAWLMLALLAVAELLGMSPWFSANAVAAQLRAQWELTPAELGWLTAAVQLGFVAGTALAALLNLADVLPSRLYFAGASLLAGLANFGMVVAPGFEAALVSRALTGLFLAGVYPPAMKMIATWFRAARGLAIGTVVGALTVGKALPYLFGALGGGDHRRVLLYASFSAVLAAGMVASGYRDGPLRFERRPFSWGLTGTIWRHRATRLAILGYLGHMWELYAVWTWLPAFVAASLAASASGAPPGGAAADLLSFGAIAAGGLGCIWGGWQADRVGRERVVSWSLAASGACSLIVGFCFGASPWLVVAVAWVWGFFVVADSAQFSALVTEVAPQHAVGTALTLQTSAGFMLTIVTIQALPLLVEVVSWRWAFVVLALGPVFGLESMRRLRRLRAAGG